MANNDKWEQTKNVLLKLQLLTGAQELFVASPAPNVDTVTLEKCSGANDWELGFHRCRGPRKYWESFWGLTKLWHQSSHLPALFFFFFAFETPPLQGGGVIDGYCRLRWGRLHRWGRAIQNPIPLSKYYGLELIAHVGQVQFQPAKRTHSPPHHYLNWGGEADELKHPKNY